MVHAQIKLRVDVSRGENMKNKISKLIVLSIMITTVFSVPTTAFAANSSLLDAIKGAVNTGGSGSALKYVASSGGSIPDAYAGYGFGTISDASRTTYGGATGGSNPYKNYWKGQVGSSDSTYQSVYTTNRTVSTAPKGNNENHNYWACYPNAGSYNGTRIDVKAKVVDYSAQSSNAVMSFGRSLSVTVLGIHWIEVKWSFLRSNGSCTGAAVSVKGNTTYWDVDNQQGVAFFDSTNRGLYVKNNSNVLRHKNISWKSSGTTHSVPFTYTTSTTNNTNDSDPNNAFTEIFEGSSLTRVYSFYESDGSSHGGIGHSNSAIVCVPKSCPNASCGCAKGKTCWA